jgi:uncharacterized transporter YbjL
MNGLAEILEDLEKQCRFFVELASKEKGYAEGYANGLHKAISMIKPVVMANEADHEAQQSEAPEQHP